MVDFELAKKHYFIIVYTINTTTRVTVTHGAKGIKVKLLGNV